MSSETLEEQKPEDEAPVDDKQEAKVEEENKEVEHKEEASKEEGKGEEGEKEEEEKENVLEVPEQVGWPENEEEKVEEKVEEKEDEKVEESEEKEGQESEKKSKRARRGSVNKDQSVSKKRGRESAEKKLSQDLVEEKKEPVTPAVERPTRERKVVERYSASSTGRSSASKALSIEKGRGTQLKDIPNVAFKLAKRKPDDNLQLLHTVLFGKKAKAHGLKRNIGRFSGYVWVENEQEKHRAKVKEKLDKCVKEKLMDFCDVLNIPISKANTRKEELSAKLLEFLESPHATTNILLADKEQKGQKRRRKATHSKSVSSGEVSPETTAKKQKQTPNVGKKRKDLSKDEDEDDKDESSDAKDDSHEVDKDDTVHEESGHDDKSDEEEEEQLSTPKSSTKKIVKEVTKVKSGGKTAPSKKTTPAKSVNNPSESTKKPRSSSKKGASDADGASGSLSKSKGSSSKKQKIEKESEKDVKAKAASKKQSSKSPAKVSAKDQVKGKNSKRAKPEPTKEEMHAVIVDILKRVDFNTATLSDILKQLGSHFGVDLMHRKAEVKDIITDVINNMTDEEDEGDEAEENTEAGDDAERDGDKDDDEDGDGDDEDDD